MGVTQSPNCSSREWRTRSRRVWGVMCAWAEAVGISSRVGSYPSSSSSSTWLWEWDLEETKLG